ncbi:MAG TPA: DUF1343 domain-containing protein [candidate division Zixibacteria bacterium]|nr:DUF1343 domain-containing protein [candidate division Zixibacteria bacterium]
MKFRLGLSKLRDELLNELSNAKVAVLCNQASVDENLTNVVDILAGSRAKLIKIFAPEHGFFGAAQDRIAIKNSTHPKYGIPIISMYGDTADSLMPKKEMLVGLDIVIIDLQDVGARYYTFVWSAALMMKQAAQAGVEIWVLDRPNPISGIVEGPVQEDSYLSFVGLYPLPIRHGMTIGEILSYIAREYIPQAKLEVILLDGWKRDMWFDDTELLWVPPSPNMPSLSTAIVYPGMCLLEGTNISEGRGTTRPFEVFGAPWIKSFELCEKLNELKLPGVKFLPWRFTPMFSKYAGQTCDGAMMFVTDRKVFRPVLTAIAIIKTIHELYPEKFKFINPPYEFETEKLPFDILCGTPEIRRMIEGGSKIDEIKDFIDGNAREYQAKLQKYLLY